MYSERKANEARNRRITEAMRWAAAASRVNDAIAALNRQRRDPAHYEAPEMDEARQMHRWGFVWDGWHVR